MGLFDTIHHSIEVDIGMVMVDNWQTKDMDCEMAELQSGDQALRRYRRLRVTGRVCIEGELVIDENGEIKGIEIVGNIYEGQKCDREAVVLELKDHIHLIEDMAGCVNKDYVFISKEWLTKLESIKDKL